MELENDYGGITKKRKRSPSPVTAGNTASASASGGNYEVFLSFGGREIREGFADYLYQDLVCRGIRTFRDIEELHVGEEIGPALLKAIKESKIFIPILSRDYASSTWRLLELAQSVECRETRGQKIIPIFYDVNVCDLRDQSKGSYGMAFLQHSKDFDEETVKKWKEAMRMVGELSGFELKSTDWHQGTLVKNVVSEVFLHLRRHMVVTEDLVGIDHHIEYMMRLLDVGSHDVLTVGIHGIGGIGKTTIAKVLYNQLLYHFECCSFLADIREKSQHGNLVNLQNELISELQRTKFLSITNVDEGIDLIDLTVCTKKVLIVLDDVDKESQIDKLVGKHKRFGLGSRIIVTTRDKELLNLLKVDRTYEPPLMEPDHSIQLFSRHAFLMDLPPRDYDILSRKVVETTAGLPLALEIIGSFLFGKGKTVWQDILMKLENALNEQVQEKLRTGFEAGNYVLKQILVGCNNLPEVEGIQTAAADTFGNTLASLNTSYATVSAFASGGEYEVVLSFADIDFHFGFIDYLYNNLVDAGIRTFMAKFDFQLEEGIGLETLKAIKESKIFIPIFSKNYAFSKRCLFELTQMVECRAAKGQRFLPIFYDVTPDDVQHPMRTYEEAFQQYKKCFDEITVQGWKEALREVGQIKGWELMKETNGYQGTLVKIVVSYVLFELKKDNMVAADNLVGIDHHIEEMMKLLNLDSSDVWIVGIHGIGGIGKTTIANVIYNQLFERFECCCFLADVREMSQQHNGLINLQNELIFKILKGKRLEITDVDIGINMFKAAVWGKKTLIVLDDVDEKYQLDKIAGKHDWFGLGSRIIVTTRNKEVLNVLQVDRTYEPPMMELHQSLQLFSKHAFRRDFPPKDYNILSGKVVLTAGGLPLALEIIGSFLYGEGKAVWERALMKLRKIPNDQVQDRIRISYEALNSKQKQKFLDISCCNSGAYKIPDFYTRDVSNFDPTNEINVLVLRSLVKIGHDNKLMMHDELKDLGRQIVFEESLKWPRKHSRLWLHDKDLDILARQKGTVEVEAGRGNFFKLETSYLSRFNLSSLPAEIDGLSLLEDLKLESCINLQHQHLTGRGNIFKLETLYLSGINISTLPAEIGALSQLKNLKLESCINLQYIPLLPVSLSEFYLENCELVERLPVLSNLKNISTLELVHCSGLMEIQGLEKLESLRYLNTSCCESLYRLPDLSNLKKLQKLVLVGCTNLVEIPGIDGLESLKYLNIAGCTNLVEFARIVGLGSSQDLNITRCMPGNLQILGMPKGVMLDEGLHIGSVKTAENSTSFASDSALGGGYEVFLSFTGKDTRYCFADYLYNDLVDVGICTFRDNVELREGEHISPELHKIIKESKISIPIFSKEYASSKWCLFELALMLECLRTEGLKIFPIFYDVEPSDVQHQTGSYEKAFCEHRKYFDETIIQGWKEALREVGQMMMMGWELRKTDGHEGKLVKMVVSKVLLELTSHYMVVTDNLVGIDCHVEEMMRLLDVDTNGVLIVGIHGFRGIGKTTIAKFIYNQLLKDFECCSFLADIRETSQHGDLVNLQNELISDLRREKFRNITNVDERIKMIKDTVCNKKVLIVLDDVDKKSQIDELVGKPDWFGLGSRIIVTTRDKEVLNLLEVDRTYEPPLMEFDPSIQLFSNHAFRRDDRPEDYDILSKNIVCTIEGLPLALEIVGSFLFGKEKEIWEETLVKLQELRNEPIYLKLAYLEQL